MTYLEIVNEVLAELRADSVTTVIGTDDEQAKLVIRFVNDAKQMVEDAWSWNANRTEWDFPTVQGTSEYVISDSTKEIKITTMSNETQGYWFDQSSPADIRRKQWGNSAEGFPKRFTLKGIDASGNKKLVMWPTPKGVYNIVIEGFKHSPDLSSDDDVLLIPSKPVIYQALALASRERGEVGGTTSAEIFAMANLYLKDAIAYDAALNPLETIWYPS